MLHYTLPAKQQGIFDIKIDAETLAHIKAPEISDIKTTQITPKLRSGNYAKIAEPQLSHIRISSKTPLCTTELLLQKGFYFVRGN